MFRVGFINIAATIVFSVLFTSQVHSLDGVQQRIMDDVRGIAYGVGLVKICPILDGQSYVNFTEKQIKAERLITFQHGGAYKLLKGRSEIDIWAETKAGTQCDGEVLTKIVEAEQLFDNFAQSSALLTEMVLKHPKNPKPNQAFIFASYLQAKQAWIVERECQNLDNLTRQNLNILMKKTQYDLEHYFRPDQLASLNKKRNERHIRALVKNCAQLEAFTRYGIKVMEQDIPQAMAVLKSLK